MVEEQFKTKTKKLIDNLKKVCSNYGLGNSGAEFKIITQVFLYKFMNDKFGYELKSIDKKIANAEKWEDEVSKYSKEDYELLLMKLSPDSAKLKPEHFISNLWNNQNESDFAKLFDDTLRDIAKENNDIFSVKTNEGSKIQLFDELTKEVTDKKMNLPKL